MEFSIPPIASFDCDTLKVYRKEEQWIDDWLECVWNHGKRVHALAYTNKRVDELNAKAVQYIDGYDITTDPYRYRIEQQLITQEGGYTQDKEIIPSSTLFEVEDVEHLVEDSVVPQLLVDAIAPELERRVSEKRCKATAGPHLELLTNSSMERTNSKECKVHVRYTGQPRR